MAAASEFNDRGNMRQWARVALNATTCLGLVMIALLWAFTAFHVKTEHDKTLEEAEHDAANLVRVFEEHIIRSIKGIDRALLLIRDGYTQNAGPAQLKNWFESINRLPDIRMHLSIIGADGYFKSTSLGDDFSKLNFSDRDYFGAHVQNTKDDLFISQPILGRATGKWSLVLSRRITAPNGAFGGVSAASIDPYQLAQFYEAVDIGKHGFISLIGLDGKLLARGGMDAHTLGRTIVNLSLLPMAKEKPAGNYWAATNDGLRRFVTYRAVRDYPLIVTVALAEDEIFATYTQNRRNYYLLASGLTLLILGVIALGILHHARLQRTRTALGMSEIDARKKSRELEVTLDHMQHGIMMVDADGNIAVVNKRLVELLELPEEFSQGRPKHNDVVDYLRWRGEFGDQRMIEDNHSDDVMKSVVDTGRFQVFERTRPNGVALKITCVPLAEGGFVRVFADITERKHDEAQVAYMVRHDTLTGLANRVLLHERMTEAAARLREHQAPFAVLGIDLDRFKAVNDTLGHPIGDKLLQQVAKRLQAAVRDIDTVARFGGDEFTVLVANQSRREDVNQLAGRLVEMISAPYIIDGNKLNVGASIGIATAPEDGIDPDVLLKNADIALYRAKAEGGGSFHYFAPEMDAHMQSRRLVEMDLRNAIANNEFVLHYQPVIDISNNRIVGAEALIRWNHPTRGLVYPGDFISLAEETGLIGPIGNWVLHAACHEAAHWAPHTRIAVNVSAAQFNRPELIGVIAQALELSGLPPHRLELEITESVLLQGDDDHLATLELLSQLGIRIALDDFGTGYSSFSYLRKFKFDTIKIDRTFVSELPDCADCSAIISAIAGLARTMGVSTTAEGVEHKDQLEWLKLAGCTHVQGFLFSKAVPPAEFRQNLEASLKRRTEAA